jgi:glutathione S-transferase
MLTLSSDAFHISPYVFTCFVALKEKALPFETKLVSLGDKAQLEAGYRAATITARVPALRHDDFWIAESLAIVEYLEDAFPSPSPRLLPAGVRERARARQVLSWLRSDDTLALREDRATSSMFYARATSPLTARGEAAADKLIDVATRLVGSAERSERGRDTLFDAWCIADADLAFMLHRLLLNGHEVPATVRAYAEAQWKRPSVREFVERERPAYVPY